MKMLKKTNKDLLNQLNDFINIRNYLLVARESFNIKKTYINDLNNNLAELEELLASTLASEDFKNCIKEASNKESKESEK